MRLTDTPPRQTRTVATAIDAHLVALRASPGQWACVRTVGKRGTAGSYAHYLRGRFPELAVTVRGVEVWASVKAT